MMNSKSNAADTGISARLHTPVGRRSTLPGFKVWVSAMVLGATALASGSAMAQHHRGHGPRVGIGIHIGAPLYWPYYPAYVYPPYYYYPPVVAVPAAPPVYVERGDGPADSPPIAQSSAPASDWFYCAESRMYYPYAREYTGGWQRVPAQPVR